MERVDKSRWVGSTVGSAWAKSRWVGGWEALSSTGSHWATLWVERVDKSRWAGGWAGALDGTDCHWLASTG